MILEFSFDGSFQSSDWFGYEITTSKVSRKFIFRQAIKETLRDSHSGSRDTTQKQQAVELNFSLQSQSSAKGDYNHEKLILLLLCSNKQRNKFSHSLNVDLIV